MKGVFIFALLCFAFVSFIGLLGFSMFGALASAETDCSDNDGLNTSIRGQCTDSSGPHLEICLSSKIVKEYYCNDSVNMSANVSDECLIETLSCEFGCDVGVCLSEVIEPVQNNTINQTNQTILNNTINQTNNLSNQSITTNTGDQTNNSVQNQTQNQTGASDSEVVEKKKGFFSNVWNWIKKLFGG